MTKQTKTNILNYLIDATLNKGKILFALFENKDHRTLFSKYYAPKVEIKDFNVSVSAKNVLMCQ